MELREIKYTLNCLGFRSPLRPSVLIKTDLWKSAVLAWVFWNFSCRRWVSDTATCQSMTSETWMMEEIVSIAKLWSRASRALWLVQYYYPLRSKHGKLKDNPHFFSRYVLETSCSTSGWCVAAIHVFHSGYVLEQRQAGRGWIHVASPWPTGNWKDAQRSIPIFSGCGNHWLVDIDPMIRLRFNSRSIFRSWQFLTPLQHQYISVLDGF